MPDLAPLIKRRICVYFSYAGSMHINIHVMHTFFFVFIFKTANNIIAHFIFKIISLSSKPTKLYFFAEFGNIGFTFTHFTPLPHKSMHNLPFPNFLSFQGSPAIRPVPAYHLLLLPGRILRLLHPRGNHIPSAFSSWKP